MPDTDGITLLKEWSSAGLLTRSCRCTCSVRQKIQRVSSCTTPHRACIRAYDLGVPKYSIVVPFHNEEENVTTLYDRVKLVMEHVGSSFEMVFVDDGSNDRTCRLLEEIAPEKIRLPRGRSHSFERSSGEPQTT